MIKSLFRAIAISIAALTAVPAVAQDWGRMMEVGFIAVDATDPYIIQRTNGRSRTNQIVWMFQNLNSLERNGRTVTGVQYTLRMVFAEGSQWSGNGGLQMPDGTVWNRDGRVWTTTGVSTSGMVRVEVPRNPARDAVNLCVDIAGYTSVVGKITTDLPNGEERRCSPDSFRNFARSTDWHEGFGFPLRLLQR